MQLVTETVMRLRHEILPSTQEKNNLNCRKKNSMLKKNDTHNTQLTFSQ